MLQKLTWIFGALAAIYGLPAAALGLGSIEVQSHLNEPFSAVINLYSLSEDDASSLQVQLASAAEFQKANINRSGYLSGLRFTVSGGRVKVSADQPVREPFLNLLVEAKAGNSRVLRSYTILFDPPGATTVPPPSATRPAAAATTATTAPSAAAPAAPAVPAVPAAPATAAKPAAASTFYQTAEEATRANAGGSVPASPAAPAAAGAAKPAPVAVAVPPPGPPSVPVAAPAAPAPTTARAPAAAPAPTPQPPAPQPAAAPAPAKDPSKLATQYGPIKAGQTFWNVANLMRPSNSVSLDQTMVAIYDENAAAFAGGFNGLLVGSTLRIPSEEKMRSLPAEAARKRAMELRSASQAQSANVAALPEQAPAISAAAAAAMAARKPAATPKPAAAVSPPAVAQTAPAVSKPPEPASAPAKPPAVVAPPATATATAAAAAASTVTASKAITPPVATKPETVVAAPEPTPAVPEAAVAEKPAALPSPLTAMAPTEPAVGASDAAEPPAEAADDPAADTASGTSPTSFLPWLGIAALLLAGFWGMTALRRRGQTATFRRDSIEDYMRPVPSLDGVGIKSATSTPDVGTAAELTATKPGLVEGLRASPAVSLAPKPVVSGDDAAGIRPSRNSPSLDGPSTAAAAISPVRGDIAPKASAIDPGMDRTRDLLREPLLDAPQRRSPVVNEIASIRVEPPVQSVPTPPAEPAVPQAAMPEPAAVPTSAPVASPELDLAEVAAPSAATAATRLNQTLNSDDPLRQADFHLSYGLYDEAVRCLMSALMRHPERQDLAIKLAETYFAAGRPADFESLASGLKDRASPADWRLLAEMGAQLCPASALFRSPRSPIDGPATSKPAAAPPSPEPTTSLPSAPAPPPAPSPSIDIQSPARAADADLKVRPDLRAEPRVAAHSESSAEPRFKVLMDLLGDNPGPGVAPSPTRPEPADTPRPPPTIEVRREAPIAPQRLQPSFDLSPATPPAAPSPSLEPRGDVGRREPRFDSLAATGSTVGSSRSEPRLDHRVAPQMDLRTPAEPTVPVVAPIERPTEAIVPAAAELPPTLEASMPELPATPPRQEPAIAEPPVGTDTRIELRLEPLQDTMRPRREPRTADVAIPPMPPLPGRRREPMMDVVAPAGPGDCAVKLDLARAYIEMDDIKAARSLLLEVAQQGNLVQQADARERLSKLPL